MSEPGSAEGFWGERAREYDAFIRRVVPRYEEMHERLAETLPPHATHILELGCGTGALSERLARQYPEARLTFVDAAPEMLEVTGARLRANVPAAAARTQLVEARFETLALQGPFDLIVASISLHHVPDPGPVYRSLGGMAAPGAAFRMADGLAAAEPPLHALQVARWQAFWQGRLDEREIAEVTDHIRRHDHYHTVEHHFTLLEAAGFTRCDCVWRDGLFTIVTAEAGA